MATLGPNDLKKFAIPTYWDAAYIERMRLASGETYEQLISDIAAALAIQNAALFQDPLMASLLAPSTSEIMIEYPIGVSNGFTAHTEYAVPDSKRAGTTGHMLPLEPYDRPFAWTWDFLKKARRMQIDTDISSGMADLRNLYHKAVLTRLFKSTYDAVGSGRSMPVADGGTADSAYVPPQVPDRATAFAYTHTHLGRLDGITQANLLTTVTHVWEHGYDGPYDCVVAEADRSSWTDTTNVTGFVPVAQEGIQYGTSETLASAMAGVFGIVETDHGPVRLRSSARIPTTYWAVYKSFGALDARNPLIIRENPEYGIGAILLAGDHIRQYPLENAIMYSEFGVGFNDRVSAALVLNASSSTYSSPTIV